MVTKLWTLAMIAFNLVLAANPITLIIIGIVALVAAVVGMFDRTQVTAPVPATAKPTAVTPSS